MRRLVIITFLLIVTVPGRAQTPPPSEIVYLHQQGAVRIELAPLPLDVIRAFYGGRGFDKPYIEAFVSKGCVFRADIGNSNTTPNAPPVQIDLSRWRRDTGDGPSPIPLKETWLADFAKRGMALPQQTAFRWATFPNLQTFQAGDFNWGMLPFSYSPGTTFDLVIWWKEGKKEHTAEMKGLTCASPSSSSPP